MDVTTPAQRRLRDELLAWDSPRPSFDARLADTLRAQLEDGVAEIFARHGRPSDRDTSAGRYTDTIWVSKSRLDRLVCDGLYRAALEEPFVHNRPIAVGTLSHLALQRDHDTHRSLSPEEVVSRAWQEVATRQNDDLAAWCNAQDDATAMEVRSEVEALLTEHRDVWPVLPSALHPRFERDARVELADGAVVLLGKPDLTVGRVRDELARMLVVDVKTGLRRPGQERQELRFYGLLLTLKHRQPPFRWASYYVAEGAWDVEDCTEALLETAVRRTLDGVEQAVRLAAPDATERLQAGRWCRFCPRRDSCEEYMSQGSGTLGP